MAVSREKKILRIGLIQNGKILVERLLRRREPVTIGQSPRNTFEIQSSDLPKAFTLFSLKGDNYVLNFKHGMNGKLSIKRSVMDFKSLREQKLAQKSGDVFSVELANENRGKIVIGEVVVLFQFVEPPPPPSKLQLPVALCRGVMQRMEWPFVSSLLGSFGLQVCFWGFTLTQDYPEPKMRLEELPERFVNLIIDKKEEEKPIIIEEESDEEDSKEEEDAIKKPAEKPKPKPVVVPREAEEQKSPEQKARESEQKKQEARAKVKNTTLIKFLGGSEGSGEVQDVGGTFDARKIEDAFAGSSSMAAVTDADAGRDRRATKLAGEGGKLLKGGKLGKGTRTGVGSGGRGKAVAVRGIVKTQAPDDVFGEGTLDPKAIQRKIARRRKAIQKCYEKELKKNPKLKGKIRLLITIKKTGRVGLVEVTQNTTNDRDVQRCVVRVFKKTRFPKPEGGSVQTEIPILLSGSK
jgi:outer membrane biosynthesis protein TonB